MCTDIETVWSKVDEVVVVVENQDKFLQQIIARCLEAELKMIPLTRQLHSNVGKKIDDKVTGIYGMISDHFNKRVAKTEK